MIKNKQIEYSLVLLIAALIGYGVATVTSNERFDDEISAARLDIAEQLTTVATLSEVLSRGGVDPVTESVIKDCSMVERDRFDLLLSRLNSGLPRPELQELSRLFDRCAAFYARRKAVMVARFDREVEIFDQLIARYARVATIDDTTSFSIAQWQELANFEREQSKLFDSLVILQGKIIDALLAGKSPNAPELTELLKEVQEVQQMQAYNSLKMREIRDALPTSL